MNQGLQRVGSAVGGEHTSAGGRLVSVDGRLLPLRGIALRGEASGGLARIVLEQRFENPYPDPLRVTYQPVLGKPFDIQVLRERVRRVLSGF